MEVGDKLNPQRSYRKRFAIKGLRQHIIKTNNPSTTGPDELLTVCFPDLKENQVIVPGEIVKGGFWCSLPLFNHFCGAPMPSM